MDTQQWYDEEGKLHRDDDLPASITSDGTMYWYNHGNLHRDNDRPAIIHPNGDMCWYNHGKRHGVTISQLVFMLVLNHGI